MSTDDRIALLEQEIQSAKRLLRRTIFLAVGCVAVSAGVVAFSPRLVSAEPEPDLTKDIRASRIVIVDDENRERIVLKVDVVGPSLEMKDPDGHSLVALSGMEIGGMVATFGRNLVDKGEWRGCILDASVPRLALNIDGNPRVIVAGAPGVAARPAGGGDITDPNTWLSYSQGLHVFDEAGDARAALCSTPDGPALVLRQHLDGSWASLGTWKNESKLQLSDAKGRVRAGLAVLEDGPSVALFDETAQIRAVLGSMTTTNSEDRVTKWPEASLLLFSPDGTLRWSAP